MVGILALRSHDFYRSRPNYSDGQRITLQAVVTDEPKLSFGKQRVKVNTTGGTRITLVTGVAPVYQYGDELVVKGVFTKSEFDGHTYWVIYFPSVQFANKEHNFVTNIAYQLRNEAKNFVESALPPVSSSLLLGIVLGGKHGMPDDFLEKLRTVGVLHVIAASGMNVSFISAFLLGFLARFLKRPAALFTAMMGISFYVIVAGFEPSIIRAAIMTSFALTGSLLGRQSVGVWILFLTGYLMLLLAPHLWEDIGFQLSFLATLGIILLKPLFGRKSILGWLHDDITTTLAAQLATLPLLLGVFGSYGLLSVFVNALILWTVPIIMALGSLGIVSGLLFAPLSTVFLFFSYPFLLFFEIVITIFGETGLVLSIPDMPIAIWIGYYMVLLAVVLVNRKKVMEKQEEVLRKHI